LFAKWQNLFLIQSCPAKNMVAIAKLDTQLSDCVQNVRLCCRYAGSVTDSLHFQVHVVLR